MTQRGWLRNAARFAAASMAAVNSGAFLVGGCLRDRLLGRPVADVDLAIEGDPIEWGQRIAKAVGGTAVVLSARQALVRVAGPARAHLDLLAIRGGCIETDLSMRDFTFNAMAVELSDAALNWLFGVAGPGTRAEEPDVIEPHGGRNDLATGIVRAVSASAFEDDPVRLLRAVRFRAELGFSIDSQTVEWMRESADLVALPASERVRDELLKLMAVEGAGEQLRLMASMGILAALLPGPAASGGARQDLATAIETVAASERAMAWLEGARISGWPQASDSLANRVRSRLAMPVGTGPQRGVMVKLAALLHRLGSSEGALDRLRLSTREAGLVRTVRDQSDAPARLVQHEHGRREAYRFFRAAGDCAIEVLIVSLANQVARRGAGSDAAALKRQAELTLELAGAFLLTPDELVRPQRILTGEDVMTASGLEAGPMVAQVLETIREAQAAGEVRTREEALDLARRMPR